MGPELARLSATIDELRAALAQLEGRLSRLEASPPVAEPPAPILASPPSEPAAAGMSMALVGRTLIVLGGAYLLRAVTDLGVLPPWLGALGALIYAAALVVLADRAASRGAAASAAFHGGTALAMAGPLVDEMVVRLHLLGAWGAAALVIAFCGATGVVAYRRRQPVLAWLGAVAMAVVAATLAVQTRQIVPCLWLLALSAAGAGLLARRLRLNGLLALPLTTGSLLSIWLAQLALAGESDHSTVSALAALLAFFAAGVAGAWWSAEKPPVQIVETLLLLPAVLVESVRLADGRFWFGGAVLALAIAGFTIARIRGEPFFRGYWLLVGLIALPMMTSGGLLALLYLAVAAALLALERADDLSLAAALVAAIVASGLAGFAARALLLPAVTPPGTISLLVLAALAGVAVMRPRPATLLLACFGTAGLLAWGGITLSSPSPAVAATIRTSVLAVAAVVLALASRHPAARAAGQLVYPVLAAMGIKLIAHDFRVGTSATLFVDLAVCGVVLMMAPRLRAETQAARIARKGLPHPLGHRHDS